MNINIGHVDQRFTMQRVEKDTVLDPPDVILYIGGRERIKDPHNELFQFIPESIHRFRQLGSEPGENQMSEPILAKLLDLEEIGKLDEGSRSDTTAITLSANFYFKYRNLGFLEKLRDKIDARERAGLVSNPARLKEAQQMPYLQATNKETLRMCLAVAQMLPREVPQNGVLLSGYKFPSKAQVGISAGVLHYNPDLITFPRALSLERWLEGHGHTLPSSTLNFAFRFGSGSHICFGENISLLELTKVIPEVVRHFNICFENPGDPWRPDVGWLTWSSYKCWIQRRKPVKEAI